MSEARGCISELRGWTVRQWWVSGVASLLVLAVVGVPTDLINTPLFSRSIGAPPWAVPVWIATALLMGLLVGTYVDRAPAAVDSRGGFGAVLGFLAVGCPVCNKLVLVSLGATGAVSVFQPIQPVLAVGSLGLLAWALQRRLASSGVCEVKRPKPERPGLR